MAVRPLDVINNRFFYSVRVWIPATPSSSRSRPSSRITRWCHSPWPTSRSTSTWRHRWPSQESSWLASTFSSYLRWRASPFLLPLPPPHWRLLTDLWGQREAWWSLMKVDKVTDAYTWTLCDTWIREALLSHGLLGVITLIFPLYLSHCWRPCDYSLLCTVHRVGSWRPALTKMVFSVFTGQETTQRQP